MLIVLYSFGFGGSVCAGESIGLRAEVLSFLRVVFGVPVLEGSHIMARADVANCTALVVLVARSSARLSCRPMSKFPD